MGKIRKRVRGLYTLSSGTCTMSLAAQAQALVHKARERNPVDIFRDDMTRAAKQGLFCVDVDLAPHHGSTGFFRSPDVQNYLGETLAEEGIKISFGEPVLVNGYPSCRLSWYSTRRVVKWSRVVREEVSAKYYKEHGVPETAPGVVTGGQKPLAAGSENDSMTNFADVKVPRYSDDVRKGGVNYNTSGAVVSAIRGRREEQAAERAAQAAEAEAR